jgi:hypothetical protein
MLCGLLLEIAGLFAFKPYSSATMSLLRGRPRRFFSLLPSSPLREMTCSPGLGFLRGRPRGRLLDDAPNELISNSICEPFVTDPAAGLLSRLLMLTVFLFTRIGFSSTDTSLLEGCEVKELTGKLWPDSRLLTLIVLLAGFTASALDPRTFGVALGTKLGTAALLAVELNSNRFSSRRLFFGRPRFFGIFGGFSTSSPFFGRPGLRLKLAAADVGDTAEDVDGTLEVMDVV